MEKRELIVQKQQESIAMLLEKLSMNMSIKTESSTPPEPKPSPESLIQQIGDFLFDPDSELTFESWFQKCEDIFRVDLAHVPEHKKVRLLLRKLGTVEHKRFINFILPKKVEDISFEETVLILSKLFGEQCSEFRKCYNCLTVTKRDYEDWMSYVSRINSDFEKSDFKSISNDHFKCLLFVCGLRNARYTDVRSRILKLIEEKQEISLQDLGDECVRMETIISDTNMIQNKTEEYGYIRKIEESPRKKNIPKQSLKGKPPSPC